MVYDIFLLLSILSFLSYIGLGLYQLSRNIHSEINRSFLYVCFAFAFWSFWYILIFYFNETDHYKNFIRFGYCGAAIYEYFIVRFTLKLTGFERKIKYKKLFYVFLAIIPLVMVYQNLVHNSVFNDRPLGFWYLFHMLSAHTYNSFTLFTLLMWYKVSNLKREKNTALLIFFGGIITIIITILVDIFFIMVKIPTLTPSIAVIWFYFIIYAMKKYRLFANIFDHVGDDILNAIDEIIIFSDSKGKISYMNNACKKHFNDSPENIREVIKEYKFIKRDIDNLFKKSAGSFGGLFHILSSSGEPMFDIKYSIILDKFSDPIGLAIVAKKIMSIIDFQIKYNITQREAEIIQEIITGKDQYQISDELQITVNTYKRHVTNIYNKLGVNNKIQLVNLLKEVHLISEHTVDKNIILPTK